MKTRNILFAATILALLSFTFVSGNQSDVEVTTNEKQVASSTNDVQGGIVMEDKAEW